jgi:hypothetical protein
MMCNDSQADGVLVVTDASKNDTHYRVNAVAKGACPK